MLRSSLFGCIFSSEDDHIYKVGKFVTVGYGGGGGGSSPPPPPLFFFSFFFWSVYHVHISVLFVAVLKWKKLIVI